MRRTAIASARLAAAIGVACCSCEPVAPPAGVSAPINACSEDCTAYSSTAGAAAACVAGACVVAHTTQNLVMVISLAQDSGFAPGRTFAVSYTTLAGAPPVMTPAGECDAGGCAALQSVANPSGQYVVTPGEGQQFPNGVGWDLGNSSLTGLPVQVTYRLQWPIPGSSISATTDAESLGLPVLPVEAVTSFNPYLSVPPPGTPSGVIGGVIYQTYVQSGVYERIMTPTPPYDQAFPPDIQVLPVVAGTGNGTDQTPITLDSTSQEIGQEPGIPVFDITSLAGPMDGWTAYLRDNTGLTISNVAPLHGPETPQVVLATAHVAPMVDALQNASLVIAPPADGAMPAFIPIGNDLPVAETYPRLPAPMTVSGQVTTTAGAAVSAAQIVFESLSIMVTSPQGMNVPNKSNFEFTRATNAAVDASGAATYSVVLPQGSYRVSVRPQTTASEVTIVDPVTVDDSSDGKVDFTVDVQRTVTGTAVVADGRPLAGATIDLLPIGCVDGSSTWCLPRSLQAPTADDGSFQLAVDPGAFWLRVKPAAGSHLPWVVQPFSMAAGSPPVVIPPITVPAPTPVGLSLFDPGGNPLINAVVRAFWLPNQGTAYELGNAMTGVDGHYDMYLAIPSQ